MASVEYTDHAKRRMRERGISEVAVESVIVRYHTSYLATRRSPDEPQTVIFVGEYQGRNLRVYSERDTDPIKVKTAAWVGS